MEVERLIQPTRLDGTVGEWLGVVRASKGFTQKSLAARAGTTQSAISRIENCRVSPSLSTIERIGLAMGVKFYISVREDRHA